MMIAKFTVPGQPLPKQRPRHGTHNTFTPKATRAAEARVALSFREALGRTHTIEVPVTGDLKFVARFYRQNQRTADLDNLLKLCTDALNGLAFADDKQIKKLRADYHVDLDNPRTEIEIWTIGGYA